MSIFSTAGVDFVPISKELVALYKNISDVLLVTSSITIALGILIILVASTPRMGRYKWFLLTELVWNFAFNVCLGLWKPVPLFPYQCAFSGGISQYKTAEESRFVLKIVVYCLTAKSCAIYAAILNRYVAALPFYQHSRLHKWMNGKYTHMLITVTTFGIQVIIVAGIRFIDKDQTQLKARLAAENKNLAEVFSKESSTFCYEMDMLNALVYSVAVIGVGLLLVSCPILLIRVYAMIQKNLARFSSVTLRLQRMLFISVFCQSCCGFLMLVVPNCFIFLCVVLHFENTHKWTIAALLAVSAHSLVDSVIMFISIKPYRNYIWKQIQACLRLRLFFKKASKESTVSVVTRRS